MPKRVRPYGSADDAESAALARNRSRSGSELSGELASTTMARDTASQVAEAVRELNDLTEDGAYFAGLDDVRDVIAVQGDRIDWDYVCRWADIHGTRQTLDEIRQSIPPI